MEPSRGEHRLAGLEALDRRQRGEAAPPPAADPMWGAASPAAAPPVSSRRASRSQAAIRTTGPFVALIPPALLGVLGWWLVRNGTSTTTGVAGFGASVLAAPLLPAWGVPLKAGTSRYLTAAAASAVLWLVLGVIAAARSSRDPWVRWRSFWAQFLWFALCAWVGVGVSLLAVDVILGRVLI